MVIELFTVLYNLIEIYFDIVFTVGVLTFEEGKDQSDNIFTKLNLVEHSSGKYKVIVSESPGDQMTIFEQHPLINDGIPSLLTDNPEAVCTFVDLMAQDRDKEEKLRLLGALPSWYKKIGSDGAKTEVAFLKNFIVTKYDPYVCFVEKKIEGKELENEAFFMVNIEYLGNSKVDEAYLRDGRTIAYSFQLPDPPSKSIGIEETIYFRIIGEQKRFFDYRGSLRYKSLESGDGATDGEATGGKPSRRKTWWKWLIGWIPCCGIRNKK